MTSTRSLLPAISLALALLASSLPSSAAIYRTVDAAGNITYTDQPPTGAAADTRTISEKIDIQAPNTFVDSTPPTPYESWNPTPTDDDLVAYQSLDITAPADNEAFRDNAGNVMIRSRLSPPLQAGHILNLELNGTLQATDGADLYLTNLPRGTHRIRMVVVDESGKRQIESQEQTFHLQRYSVQQKNRGNTNPPTPPPSAKN